MTNGLPKIKGIAIDFGGTTMIVPPLSLGAMQQLQEGLANFTGDIRDPAQIALIIDATHAALRRNYPELTREQAAEILDLENMSDVMQAVMDVSGLKRKAKEADASGEAQPGS